MTIEQSSETLAQHESAVGPQRRSPRLEELPPTPNKTGWPWTEESPRLPDVTPDGRPWPRISIVTPSFNQSQFLEETIRSVLLQGYPDLEYIVIDGGSTDSSVEIIRKYEPWLAFWVSEQDRGQSHAINKGFQRATGDVCAWLNSDDVYLRGALGAAALGFVEDPERSLVYGDLVLVDEASAVQGFMRAPSFSLESLISHNYISQPAAFMRTADVKKVGYLDESYHLCMDYDLWLRLAPQGTVAHLDKTLAAFRTHSESKTSMQLTRMSVELAKVATLFLEKGQAPLELQKDRDKLLARPFWSAGVMLWFSGNHEEGKQYVQAALSGLSAADEDDMAVSLASAAVGDSEADAQSNIQQFLDEFPSLKPIERQAKAWSAVFLARGSLEDSTFYGNVFRGLKQAPSARVFRAVFPLVLSKLLGVKLYQNFWQAKRSLTHSPVGVSLSEL